MNEIKTTWDEEDIQYQIDYLKHLKEDYDSIWKMCGTIAFSILIAIVSSKLTFNIFSILFSIDSNPIDFYTYLNIILVIAFFSCIVNGGYVMLKSNKCYREINILYKALWNFRIKKDPNKNKHLNRLYTFERPTRGFKK